MTDTETFQAICEFLPDAVLLTDLRGIITSGNRRAENLFGYGEGELTGREIETLVPDRFREVHRLHREKYYARTFVRPMGSGLTLTGRRKDGSEFPAEISLSPFAAGAASHVISVIRDISDRLKLEDAIRESEARYRSLVELSPEAIVVHSGGTILYANDATARLLKAAQADELIGKSLLDFVPAEHRERIMERMRDLLEFGQRRDPFMVRTRNEDGKEVFLEALAARINFHGRPAAQVILRDVSAHIRAEEELRTSREQLRDLSGYLQSAREEERTSIAREIHDELGGALTALKLDLASIEDVVPPGEPAGIREPFFEKIETMASLIDNTIQTVRRMATGLRPVLLDSLGLSAAIEWQAEEFEKRTGIECEVSISGDDARLDRDRSTAVFRIFQETLTNISRHAAASHVTVDLRYGDHELALSVRDNGRGITEEQAANGKSLGLLGMRERALLYGGELSVQGTPGEGTAVSMRIPL